MKPPCDFEFFGNKFTILWSSLDQFEAVEIRASARITGFILNGQRRVLVILHSRETTGSLPFQMRKASITSEGLSDR